MSTNASMVMVVWLSASAALAQTEPKPVSAVAIGGISGPHGKQLRGTVVKRLCQQHLCVSPSQNLAHGAPIDWSAAHGESIQAVITGKVKGRQLQLFVHTDGHAALKRTVTLNKKAKVSSRQWKKVEQGLDRLLANATPEPEEPELADAEEAEDAADEVAEEAPSAKTKPAGQPTAEAGAQTDDDDVRDDDDRRAHASSTGGAPIEGVQQRLPERIDPEARTRPALIVDLGGSAVSRSIAYQGLAAGPLASGGATTVGAPRVGLAFHPFLLVGLKPLEGLGFEGAYARSLVKFGAGTGAGMFPLTSEQIDFGVRWSLPVLATQGFALAVAPAAGFRHHSLVAEGAGGVKPQGLPAIRYSSLRFGARLEGTIAERVTTGFEGSYLQVLDSGELVSPTYFSRGSSRGFELEGSVGVRITSAIELRGTVTFARYLHTFQPSPADAYVASSGVDQLFGGGLALRLGL